MVVTVSDNLVPPVDDGLHCLARDVVADGQLDLDLRQEVDHVFGATIQLGVALLSPETLHLTHRHPGDANLPQRFAHVVEFEGFDNRHYLLHRNCPLSS